MFSIFVSESPTSNNSSGHRRRSASQQGVQRQNGSPTNSKSRERSSRSRDGSPRSYIRPRSEEIPLEDFRRSQNSSPAPLPNNTRPSTPRTESSGGNTIVAVNANYQENSEETSFIRDEQRKNRKGIIETV